MSTTSVGQPGSWPRRAAFGVLAASLLAGGAAWAGAAAGLFDPPLYGTLRAVPFHTGPAQARDAETLPLLLLDPDQAPLRLTAPFIVEAAFRFEPASSPDAAWTLELRDVPESSVPHPTATSRNFTTFTIFALFNDGTWSILEAQGGAVIRSAQRMDFLHLRPAGGVNRIRLDATAGGWLLRINDEEAEHGTAPLPVNGLLNVSLVAPHQGLATLELLSLSVRRP